MNHFLITCRSPPGRHALTGRHRFSREAGGRGSWGHVGLVPAYRSLRRTGRINLGAGAPDEDRWGRTRRQSLPPSSQDVSLQIKEGVGPTRQGPTRPPTAHPMPSSVFQECVNMVSNTSQKRLDRPEGGRQAHSRTQQVSKSRLTVWAHNYPRNPQGSPKVHQIRLA